MTIYVGAKLYEELKDIIPAAVPKENEPQDFSFENDILICNHCKQEVTTGIVNVSNHWMNCLKRTERLIFTTNNSLDKLSINV